MPQPFPGDFLAGFKVNVGPSDDPPVVWRYSINYKPRPAANGECRAVVWFVTDPYP